jgi:hypothetical protein
MHCKHKDEMAQAITPCAVKRQEKFCDVSEVLCDSIVETINLLLQSKTRACGSDEPGGIACKIKLSDVWLWNMIRTNTVARYSVSAIKQVYEAAGWSVVITTQEEGEETLAFHFE